jgi:uncharacterized membrane protein YesL
LVGIFNIDGPLYKIGGLLADILILSILWFFCTILTAGIGFGACTTAIYYVATKRIYGKEGYIIKDFFKSFKENFVQSTIIGLIMGIAITICIYNITLIYNPVNVSVFGDKLFMLPIQFCFVLELFLMATYVFPLIARFKMTNFNIIKTSFFMANRHFLTSIIFIATSIIILVISYMYPPFILVSMGAYSFITAYYIMKIFKKYRPEIDADNTSYDEFTL